jgi:ParB-like chromosome segregation protein Spo0J
MYFRLNKEGQMTTVHAKDITQMPVSDLIPYDRNPNIHSNEQIVQLANSIREWGFTIPILIDEKEVVLAGHGRLFAAKSLGMETVPCIIAKGWSDPQKKAYVIADNKLSEGSEWDSSLYFSELKEINSSGFNLSLIGFDDNVSLDFEPNLDPSTSYTDVNADDIDKAQNSMSSNMDRLTGDRSARGAEVMCPYCAETFTFDGI